MIANKSHQDLSSILDELLKLPRETEWVEFKCNNGNPDEIGEYLSALANSALLTGKITAYMIWGIDNATHQPIGTTFRPKDSKKGNEELENWLLRSLSPKIDFCFYELLINNVTIILLEIAAAFSHPVQFKGEEYIRIGSYKKKLKEYPEKERALWRCFDRTSFEREIAIDNVRVEEVLRLLDYPAYFELTNTTLPENRERILERLRADELIIESTTGRWNITNLGAILFAKELSSFTSLKYKAVRVVHYDGETKLKTIREQVGGKGYASGFKGLIQYIMNLLPNNEIIEKATRKNIPMFPDIAVRELVANAIIHQDFYAKGIAPMIELFSDRMEITNAGKPLIDINRFLDTPPRSRNEALASFMRRIGFCEERGSGIDKVVIQTERYQLPAPIFETVGENTRVILFSHKEFNDMDKTERIRACYLHASLRYTLRDYMTNTTLRERFAIEAKNSAIVSRIIADTVEAKLIRCYDEAVGNKARKYLPSWA